MGHTDATGDALENKKLSERRAAAVSAYLKKKNIQLPVVSIGAGAEYPVASNKNSTGRDLNRRIEIIYTEKESDVTINRDSLYSKKNSYLDVHSKLVFFDSGLDVPNDYGQRELDSFIEGLRKTIKHPIETRYSVLILGYTDSLEQTKDSLSQRRSDYVGKRISELFANSFTVSAGMANSRYIASNKIPSERRFNRRVAIYVIERY